jgi:hypothetical protein
VTIDRAGLRGGLCGKARAWCEGETRTQESSLGSLRSARDKQDKSHSKFRVSRDGSTPGKSFD